MAAFVRGKKRLAGMDPFDRQIAFLKVGLYSGCFFGALLILIAMGSQRKLLLGLIIAAIFLVVMLPLDKWMVQTIRRRQVTRRSDDPTRGRDSFSRLN
jgi:hypothetical protein